MERLQFDSSSDMARRCWRSISAAKALSRRQRPIVCSFTPIARAAERLVWPSTSSRAAATCRGASIGGFVPSNPIALGVAHRRTWLRITALFCAPAVALIGLVSPGATRSDIPPRVTVPVEAVGGFVSPECAGAVERCTSLHISTRHDSPATARASSTERGAKIPVPLVSPFKWPRLPASPPLS